MLKEHQSFAYAFFGDQQAAQAAVQRLLDAGFDSEDIGVVMQDEESSEPHTVAPDHKTGVGPGAAIGALLGVAAGAAALPAAGLIAVGGAFATLGGAAVGGAAGGVTGALGGLGFWKDDPAVSSTAFEHGEVLVGALASAERAQTAQSSLTAAGAHEVKLATEAEAKQELEARAPAIKPRGERNISPDRLADRVFLLTIAYVLAVAGSIWFFIRPV